MFRQGSLQDAHALKLIFISFRRYIYNIERFTTRRNKIEISASYWN